MLVFIILTLMIVAIKKAFEIAKTRKTSKNSENDKNVDKNLRINLIKVS